MKITKKAIRTQLNQSLFDPKYDMAYKFVIEQASPTYNMRKAQELINEAIHAIDAPTANEKLEQAISLLALTKAMNKA